MPKKLYCIYLEGQVVGYTHDNDSVDRFATENQLDLNIRTVEVETSAELIGRLQAAIDSIDTEPQQPSWPRLELHLLPGNTNTDEISFVDRITKKTVNLNPAQRHCLDWVAVHQQDSTYPVLWLHLFDRASGLSLLDASHHWYDESAQRVIDALGHVELFASFPEELRQAALGQPIEAVAERYWGLICRNYLLVRFVVRL